MDRPNHRDRVEQIVRIATAATCIAAEIAKAIWELTRIPGKRGRASCRRVVSVSGRQEALYY